VLLVCFEVFVSSFRLRCQILRVSLSVLSYFILFIVFISRISTIYSNVNFPPWLIYFFNNALSVLHVLSVYIAEINIPAIIFRAFSFFCICQLILFLYVYSCNELFSFTWVLLGLVLPQFFAHDQFLSYLFPILFYKYLHI
jgi:hypothetical protein